MAACGLSVNKSMDAPVEEPKTDSQKTTPARDGKKTDQTEKKAPKPYMSRRDQEAEIKRILQDLAGKNTKQIGKALHKRRRSLPRFLDELTEKYITAPTEKRQKKIERQHSAEALMKAQSTLRSWGPWKEAEKNISAGPFCENIRVATLAKI